MPLLPGTLQFSPRRNQLLRYGRSRQPRREPLVVALGSARADSRFAAGATAVLGRDQRDRVELRNVQANDRASVSSTRDGEASAAPKSEPREMPPSRLRLYADRRDPQPA